LVIPSRKSAFRQAKRDARISVVDQPFKVEKAIMTDSNKVPILDSNKKPIMTTEYHYKNIDGKHIIIQNHAAGHQYPDGIGNQGPHYNVRPTNNPRTGKVPGTEPIMNLNVNKMNILNIIYNNIFIKQLYPDGISKLALTNLRFDCFGNIELTLQIQKKPNIDVTKWGKWEKDFNIVALKITSNMLENIDIVNWKNVKLEECDYKITLLKEDITNSINNLYNIIFYKEDWQVILTTKSLLYQEANVYILEKSE
jgi:hypothetical protein